MILLLLFNQYKYPPSKPNKNPSGPVIKRPSNGPWPEPAGLKIIGPKNPIQKEKLPSMIPPNKICVIKPGFTKPSFLQIYQPTPIVKSEETTTGIQG